MMAGAQKKAEEVRPAFWAMLLLALLGSGAMQWLALHAKENADPDLRIAVYRYQADTLPDCGQLLGRTALPSAADDAGAMWVRLQVPPLTEIATGACRISAPVAM